MIDRWEFNKIAAAAAANLNKIKNAILIDYWEFNKIAAAVLAALLVIFGSGVIFSLAQNKHDKENIELVGYKLPVQVASADTQDRGAAKKEGIDFAKIAGLMKTASVDAGAAGFKKCSTCHTPNQGGKNGTGPNLWNIVNREIGKVSDFSYSNAMAAKGGVWNFESLAQFLHKPKAWVQGTKMAFGGINKDEDIANILIYLRSLSDSPADLPVIQEAAATEKTTPASAVDKAADPATAAEQKAKPETAPPQ